MLPSAQAVPADPPPDHDASPPRLWFVDNLRTVLIALVVLHHVACVYSGLPAWYYTEKPTSPAAGLGLTIFLLVDQAWFMGAFFLIAGYFTPGSYDRKGPRAFLRDRLTRLGIPLVVFYFVLNPILCLGTGDEDSPVAAYLRTIGSGPLWFALALLVLDGCYAAFRHATRRRPPRGGTRPLTPGAVIGFVLALALASYALRIVIPSGASIPVVDFPSGSYLAQYVSFFVVGTVAYRRGWFLAVTARMRRIGTGLAVGATLVCLPLAMADGTDAWTGRGTLDSLYYALWDSAFAVGIVLILLAVFRRRLDTQGPLRRYLARNVFAVYVTHAFVVTAAGYALSASALPTMAKFAIVGVVALPVSFLLADLVRRLPGVRRVL